MSGVDVSDDFETQTEGEPLDSTATPPPEPPAVEAASEAFTDWTTDGTNDDGTDLVEDTPEEAAEKVAQAARDEKGRFAKKADAEAEPDAATADPKAGKPRHDPEARIAQAVARQREAERKADELQRQIEARQAPAPAGPDGTRETPAQEWQRLKAHPHAPKLAEFDTYEDWTGALGVFINDVRHEERSTRERQQAEQSQSDRAQQAVYSAFAASVDTATAANPQFLDAIHPRVLQLPTFAHLQPGERPTNPHFLGEELLRTPDPAAAMQYLSDHLDELQRIVTLQNAREITREMAILFGARPGAASATGTAPAPPRVSTAKPPVRPVTGSPSTMKSDAPDPDDDDLDAHMRYYNAQDRKRAAQRM